MIRNTKRSGRAVSRIAELVMALMLAVTTASAYGAETSSESTAETVRQIQQTDVAEDRTSEEKDTITYDTGSGYEETAVEVSEEAKAAYGNEDPEFFRYYTVDENGSIVAKNGDDGGNQISTFSRSTASQYKHPDKYKNHTIYNCIDVSEHQNSNINWKQVKAAGITHAIIRVAYRGYGSGKIVEDAYYETNIKNAYAAGLKVGVYIYSQAVSEKEAQAEADFIIKCIKPYKSKISMPVVFDYEFSPVPKGRFTSAKAKKLGKTKLTNNCIAFSERVKKSGYVPMVYGSYKFLEDYVNRATLEKKYKMWLAHYDTSTSYPGEFYMWQYSSKGSVRGITGNVDMNFIYHSKITVKDVKDYTAYTSTALNYRTDYGNGTVEGTLKEGTKIIITATASGWGRLGGSFEGKDYWVKLSYTRKPSDIRKYAKDSSGKYRFIRYDGKTAVSRWITFEKKTYYVNSSGDKLKGYRKVGDYHYLFNSSGVMKTGSATYGSKKYKLLSNGKAVLFTAKTKTSVNYRTGPSTKDKVKGTYKKNKTVSVIREKSGWGQMSSGYWLKLKYTKKVTKYPVKVFKAYKAKTTTDVNYRKGPGTSYKKAGAYRKGKTITIKAVKNGWGKMSNGYWLDLKYTKKI